MLVGAAIRVADRVVAACCGASRESPADGPTVTGTSTRIGVDQSELGFRVAAQPDGGLSPGLVPAAHTGGDATTVPAWNLN